VDAKSLKGMAVVTTYDGEKIGAVEMILFDPDGRSVQAFTIGSGSLLGGPSHIVELHDVQSIGSDAIMIPDRTVLRAKQSDERYQRLIDLKTITSLRVVSTEGSVVGNLHNVRFDPLDGAITDIEIGHGGLLGALRNHSIVPARHVVSIGRDVAVIRDLRVPEPDDPSQTGLADDAETNANAREEPDAPR
jgi:uncharacterized protein YrrD